MAGYIPPADNAADLELAGKYNPTLLAPSNLSLLLEPFDTGDTTLYPPPRPALDVGWGLRWNKTNGKAGATAVRYNQSAALQLYKAMPWGDGKYVDALRGGGWNEIPARDVARIFPWGASTPKSASWQSGYESVPPRDLGVTLAWDARDRKSVV